MLDIFRKLVLLTSSIADENGNITKLQSTGESPDTIGDKRLVLHEKYQLSGVEDPTWQQRVLFNPLSENVTATTITPSLEWFMRGAAFRLNVTFMVLIKEMLRIAASPAEHEKLTPSQLEFVTKLADIDAPVADFFDKSIANLAAKGEWTFIKLFPKHAGTIGGIKYNRTCHVSFPIYEELLTERKFGKNTAMPKGASLKLASLMQLLLPDIALPDSYSAGSNSRMAPYCEAVIASLVKLYSCISRHQRLWPDMWASPEADPTLASRMGIIDYQWLDYLRNTDALIDEIRALPNAGNSTLPAAVPSAAQAFANATRQEVSVQAAPHQHSYQPPQQTQRPNQNYSDPQPQRTTQPGTSNMTMAEIARNRDQQCGGGRGGGGGYYNDRQNDYYNNNRNYNGNGGRYGGGGGGWAD